MNEQKNSQKDQIKICIYLNNIICVTINEY